MTVISTPWTIPGAKQQWAVRQVQHKPDPLCSNGLLQFNCQSGYSFLHKDKDTTSVGKVRSVPPRSHNVSFKRDGLNGLIQPSLIYANDVWFGAHTPQPRSELYQFWHKFSCIQVENT